MTKTFGTIERILGFEEDRLMRHLQATLTQELAALEQKLRQAFLDEIESRQEATRQWLHEQLDHAVSNLKDNLDAFKVELRALEEERHQTYIRRLGQTQDQFESHLKQMLDHTLFFGQPDQLIDASLILAEGNADSTGTSDLDPESVLDIYVSEQVIEKIMDHTGSYASRRLEAMGLLLGDVRSHNGRQYTIVQDAVTSGLDTTAVSVRFNREGFSGLFEQLEQIEYDYLIIGWYHSHPGYTCFMSPTDVDTQRRMFRQQYQTAMVVDPVRKELKAYTLISGGYREQAYGIYDADEYPHPIPVKYKYRPTRLPSD